MIKEYKTIQNTCSGEIEEKKSRFIATLYHVESEEAAVEIIDSVKKKYWDARHNCYAYILGKDSSLMRFSDDGEPSGTAGKPILEVLKGCMLTDTLAVVTRYFGGVLLGTGGLVRAYTESTQVGIDNGEIATIRLMQPYEFSMDYQMVGKIKYRFNELNICITDEQYTDNVTMKIVVSVDECDMVEKLVTEISNGKIVLDRCLHSVVYL